MKYVYGADDLDPVMNSIEYAPHTNPHWDPFSVVHNVSFLLLSRLVAIICLSFLGPWRRQEYVSDRLYGSCWIQLINAVLDIKKLEMAKPEASPKDEYFPTSVYAKFRRMKSGEYLCIGMDRESG